MSQLKKLKVLYVISDIDKSVAFEWVATYLNKQKFDLSFILLNKNPSHLESFLEQHGMDVTRIHCDDNRNWVNTCQKPYRHIDKQNPGVVHFHLYGTRYPTPWLPIS